jgi:hypothetical protein
MSFLSVTPEQLESAAQDLLGIRDTLSDATATAAVPTTGVLAAAEDEVSTAIASMFSAHGQQYQLVSAQASAFHDEFVKRMNAGVGAYLSTEVANAENNLLNAVNSPIRELLGGATPAASSGGILGAAEDVVAKITAAVQAAEPGLAKGGSELLLAGQGVVTGVNQLQPAFNDLTLAGNSFVAFGTDAAVGLGDLGSAAAELVGGIGAIGAGLGSVASGVGLVVSVVPQLLTPVSIATIVPSIVGGVGLVGTGVVGIVGGVHELTLIGGNVTNGIAALGKAGTEFSQGLGYVTLAQQAAAPGLATLQIAGTQFAQGLTDVKTGADAAAAVLGLGS